MVFWIWALLLRVAFRHHQTRPMHEKALLPRSHPVRRTVQVTGEDGDEDSKLSILASSEPGKDIFRSGMLILADSFLKATMAVACSKYHRPWSCAGQSCTPKDTQKNTKKEMQQLFPYCTIPWVLVGGSRCMGGGKVTMWCKSVAGGTKSVCLRKDPTPLRMWLLKKCLLKIRPHTRNSGMWLSENYLVKIGPHTRNSGMWLFKTRLFEIGPHIQNFLCLR